MQDADTVLFSQHDARADIDGNLVALFEGLKVIITMEDYDANGKLDPLIATGLIIRNKSDVGWGAHVKWCCRIGPCGIAHQSDKQ